MKVSDHMKSIITEYADTHRKDYLEFLDEYFLNNFGDIRPVHDEGGVYLKLWFYESKHPMEDI